MLCYVLIVYYLLCICYVFVITICWPAPPKPAWLACRPPPVGSGATPWWDQPPGRARRCRTRCKCSRDTSGWRRHSRPRPPDPGTHLLLLQLWTATVSSVSIDPLFYAISLETLASLRVKLIAFIRRSNEVHLIYSISYETSEKIKKLNGCV